MSGGGGKTTVQSNKIDPGLLKLYEQNYARAEDLAETPYRPYTEQRFAGFTPQQETYMQNAADTARLTQGGMAPAYQAMQGALNPAVRDVQAGQVADADLDAYLNPYTDSVINRTLDNLERSRQQAVGQGEAAALGAGAYGGSRHGVADAQTNEAYARQAADTAAQLNAQNYNRATQLAGGDIARRMQAGQINQGADVTRAGLAGDAAGRLFNLGLGGQDLLARIGQARQAAAQQGRDFDYQQFLAEQAKPREDMALLNSVISGFPVSSTTTQTQPGGNRATGALGGALAGAQLGSFAGPWGTGIGAVLGGTAGLLG